MKEFEIYENEDDYNGVIQQMSTKVMSQHSGANDSICVSNGGAFENNGIKTVRAGSRNEILSVIKQ
jgi:hypothetical protein